MKWYDKNKSITKVNEHNDNLQDSTNSFDNYFSKIHLEEDLSADELNPDTLASQLEVSEDIEKTDTTPLKEMKVSTIQHETKVLGDIVCEGHLTVYGIVKGNIHCAGNVHIFGSVYGPIDAQQVMIEDCTYTGNITCSELLLNHNNTTIIGNINANNIVSLGKIKGNVDVANRFRIGNMGVVIGDISAGLMSLEEGAIVQGKVMIHQDFMIDENE